MVNKTYIPFPQVPKIYQWIAKKKMFSSGKNWNFEPIENFARIYHMIFDLRKDPANTLTPLSLNVNNANINLTQTDN